MPLVRSAGEADLDVRRGWMLPAVLLVLLAAMVLTSVVLWRDRAVVGPTAAVAPAPADVETDGSVWGVPSAADPVETARLAAQAYYSLDYRHLTSDAERLRAVTTSGYRARYDTMLDGVRADLQDRRVVTSAEPVADGTATEALDATSARVLVALDVSSTEVGSPARRTPTTVRVELRQVAGAWLVSDLRAVTS